MKAVQFSEVQVKLGSRSYNDTMTLARTKRCRKECALRNGVQNYIHVYFSRKRVDYNIVTDCVRYRKKQLRDPNCRHTI